MQNRKFRHTNIPKNTHTHTHTSLVKCIATLFFSREISNDQSISDQELLLIINYHSSMTIFKVYSV